MSSRYPDALVYIAYARADRARIEPIVAALREMGLSLAFDAERAHGTGNHVHDSQQALRQAGALIVFYSQAAAQSPWIEAEARAFQSRMISDTTRRFVVVALDETPLPQMWSDPGKSDSRYRLIDAQGETPFSLAQKLGFALYGEPLAAAPPDLNEEIEFERGGPGAFGSAWDDSAEVVATEVESPPLTSEPSAEASAEPSAEPSAPPPPPPAPAPPPYVPPPATPGSDTGGRLPLPATPPAPQPDRSGYAPEEPGATWDAAPKPSMQPAPQPTRLEQVTFTAYHPREMQAQQWQPLVVYLSLDDPATMAQVASAAAERLAGKLDQFRPGRSDKSASLARGTALRIVPTAPGVVFNPSHLDVTWQEDVQQHEFRMRAETARPGQAVNGVVQFYQGMLLRAEVPFSVFVGQAAARLDSPDAYQKAIARAYRRIFASYSHQDMPVVESCETAARTMGDQYLRDVSLLQSGQQWDPRLIQAINDADIFQLFWSRRAATSPFVEREWRHALMLLPTRPNFIRPVYWSRQLYPTPSELNALHFQPLSLATLGWGQLRIAWYNMQNR